MSGRLLSCAVLSEVEVSHMVKILQVEAVELFAPATTHSPCRLVDVSEVELFALATNVMSI